MTKLRSIALVAVLGAALFAPQAKAEDGGWNTKYGMVFSLANPFNNTMFLNAANEADIVSGGLGLQYNLGPQSAVRAVLRLSRTSDPPYTTETQTSGGPIVTQDVIPAVTSAFGVGLGGSYLMRLTTSALAPYVGAGAGVFWDSTARQGTDDDTVGTTIVYDDSSRTIGLGLTGQIGLEWRVHKSLSLFAEYGLNITAFSSKSVDNKTTTNGTPTTEKWTQTKLFNFDTALNQGAQLGLVAFF